MTKREMAIVTAFTGIVCGNFSYFHEYVQELLNRPVWTHEFASKELMEKIKELSKKDFIALKVEN
ncbi:hypothetical protein Dip510_001581 [Elusimicrobium posterum]|uniref:DUF7736 domain-containing protein n=2 Tax=Elusimicrobium posterum TaxID=3116653 RepID=UPI003C778CAD